MKESYLETSIDRILKDLNEEQLAAVTHGEGPLLIVAGAGTGKTRVITQRIAYLIASKKAKPEEILALTFTDKAAEEMIERVDMLVPYGYANVRISTFHAFGDHLLREYALELGLTPDIKVLSPAEQVIFFREHLFDFPLHFYRPLGDPTKFIQAMLTLFSRAKDEDISPEEYLQYAENLKSQAQLHPDNEELQEEAQKQKEIARTFQLYQQMMAKEGKIDFGDQVALVLRLFRQRPTVLKKVQDQFKYILVDEFQDTNYAQFQLLKLLAAAHHNITVVGDDDQSIYKFRGAAISNILHFMDTYPDAKQIVLVKNYRSTQEILDTAYQLILHNNPDRLEVKNQIDKRLIAMRDSSTGENPTVHHLHFDQHTTEADSVAETIEKKVKNGKYCYRDFAILVRTNNDADPFLRSLNMRSIPWSFSGNRGLYHQPEVLLLISFLRSLSNFAESTHLYHLASSEIYHLTMAELVRCMNLAQRKNLTLYDVFEHLDEIPELSELSGESKATIKKIVDDIQHYLGLSRENPTGVVLYEFLTRSGYLKRLVGTHAELKIKNIARFFNIVRNFGEVAQHDRVQHFVEYLDLLIEAGDDPASAEADPDVDAVQVLTVHKAKGLEFPIVFLVGLVQNKFPHSRRKEPLELPEALIKDILPSGDFHLQEERRLFYVGMTRAQNELYLTSARDYGTARSRKISQFVLEALDKPRADTEYTHTSALETIEQHAPPPEGLQDSLAPIPDDEIISLSFFKIDDYLTCPLKYKYVHILRVPILPHHTVIYGKALHDAIGEYYRRKTRGYPVTLDDLYQVFENSWMSEGFLSREHEEMRLRAGKEALARFFATEEANGIMPLYVEKEFSFFIGKNRIIGRWDRVDQRDNDIVIVDFKSSEIRDQKTADRRAKESLQLIIYAMAYQHQFGLLPSYVELHFLETGLVGTYRVNQKDLEKAIEQIHLAATGIRQRNYTAKPNYMACKYCAYSNICPSSAG
ncbi:hypothetical protein DRQ00_03525 [candidate division KSB1 bacterium]|nr:MAG: hypothetical protein DRQ00_03525 [candidate division KSB1 bacterium]